MELNKYQKEAVLDDSNVCLVRANVGSGKTTVLIEKIRYLYSQKQVPLEKMIVLTFTNKAAAEIQERLQNSEIRMPEEKLYYGTFHSITFHMLQEILPVEELGYTKEFQVCLPEEELELAEELISREKLKIKYKNRLQKRLELSQGRGTGKVKDYKDDFQNLVKLLKEEKKKQNKMSYTDLLKNCIFLLEKHPGMVCPEWIIIDEVQDCDELQLEMIKQLKKPETRLFAVGDPNQVIYSWRGSVFNIFYRLREQYQAKELSLPVNYRSSGTILKAAGRFQQSGTALEGTRDSGEKIQIQNHYDPFQEAGYLVEKIRELHENNIEYDQIAVFYRLQNQSEILEKVFQENQIPCEVSQKKSPEDVLDVNREIPEEKTVKLMTLHASKGLEFRYVFIIGVNDGLIPLNPRNEEEEEEERRLFYVGMTRAKEFLELSYYTNPDGVRVFPGPGRYLSFFPENITDRGVTGEKRDRKEAAEHLQNMKRMILEERQKLNTETEKFEDKKRVAHPKYGQGTVLSEDETMITVEFDDYGEKELLKAFSNLEEM